jgi:hypothetical protein
MAPRRTRREKAAAVVLADSLNSSEAAGKQLGVNPRNIRRWRDDPELSEIVRKTRDETAEDISAAMVLSWTRLIERLERDEIDTRDLIILAGVATDKAQLLTGHATDRTETRDVTDFFDDHEQEVLNEVVRGELSRRADLARRADAEAAGVAVESAGEAGAEGTAR